MQLTKVVMDCKEVEENRLQNKLLADVFQCRKKESNKLKKSRVSQGLFGY